jgi:hypothetical protein
MAASVDDFDLRYDDRVLAFHVYINTDRDPSTLGHEIQRAARSPQLDAQACWIEGYTNGAETWKTMLQDRSIKNDPVLRYEGKLLVFHLFVNTDRNPYHIHKAILRVARGPRLDACVAWSELYEGENGRKVWSTIQKAAVKTLSSPNTRPFDASSADGPTDILHEHEQARPGRTQEETS